MSLSYKQLPSPRGLPLIGHLHLVRLSGMHAWLERLAKEYGDAYRLQLGPARLTVISKPELIQTILKSRPDTFRRVAKLDRVMQEEGIHGVFNAEGESWKVHRRIVTRGLDIRHQQAFFPFMSHITQRLYQKMYSLAISGEPYAVRDDLLRYTVDVTTSLAFGMDMNTLDQQGGVIQDHMEKIFPTIFRRINSPIPWYKFFTSSREKAFRHAMQEVEAYVQTFIAQGHKRLQDNPSLTDRPENILDALLVAAGEEDAISQKEIKSNLLTLLMAGEDTTAHSLAWAIFLLAQRPNIQTKLQSEADEVLGDDPVLSDYQKQDRLSYTQAVIQETLRLKSVAPVMLVEPNMDVDMGGYRFTKGSRLVLLTRYAGLQENYFSFADEMCPERWLEQTTRSCPVHRIEAFLPFGWGARMCPGRNLAMLEMKLVLSMMAKHFHIEIITPPEQVKENMAFTMMPDRYEVRLSLR